jgi:AbrB family looped-hinge helix DNA binding protein
MKIVKLLKNGRITIPAEIRREHSLVAGSIIHIEPIDGGYRIIPTKKKIPKGKIRKWLNAQKRKERGF